MELCLPAPCVAYVLLKRHIKKRLVEAVQRVPNPAVPLGFACLVFFQCRTEFCAVVSFPPVLRLAVAAMCNSFMVPVYHTSAALVRGVVEALQHDDACARVRHEFRQTPALIARTWCRLVFWIARYIC